MNLEELLDSCLNPLKAQLFFNKIIVWYSMLFQNKYILYIMKYKSPRIKQ